MNDAYVFDDPLAEQVFAILSQDREALKAAENAVLDQAGQFGTDIVFTDAVRVEPIRDVLFAKLPLTSDQRTGLLRLPVIGEVADAIVKSFEAWTDEQVCQRFAEVDQARLEGFTPVSRSG